MTSDPDPIKNRYSSFTEEGSATTPKADLERTRLIHRFRTACHLLGALWMVMSSIGLATAGYVAYQDLSAPDPGFPIVMAGVGALCFLWLILGIALYMKQAWGLVAGLAFSYISLVSNALQLNLCAATFAVVLVVLGHIVLSYFMKMRGAGLPLNARP